MAGLIRLWVHISPRLFLVMMLILCGSCNEPDQSVKVASRDARTASLDDAHLELAVNVFGAIVIIDGKCVGTTVDRSPRRYGVAPGIHQLLIQHVGYHDSISTISLSSGETRRLRADLVPHLRHYPQVANERRLSPGDIARGALDNGDLDAAEVGARFGLKSQKPLRGTWADVYRLEGPAFKGKAELFVSSSGSQVEIVVIDLNGAILYWQDVATWMHRFTVIVPVSGAWLVVTAREFDKNARFGLTRYVLSIGGNE